MPASPIPPQNHSAGLSAPFQFNSKPNSSPQRMLQSSGFSVCWPKRDISYRRLLLHNDRMSLRKRDSHSVICNPRGLFTYKEKIPWPFKRIFTHVKRVFNQRQGLKFFPREFHHCFWRSKHDLIYHRRLFLAHWIFPSKVNRNRNFRLQFIS